MQVGKDLVVMNLSSQSETSDLLGGMKPVQAWATLVALSRTFAPLLQSTWPAGKNAEFLTRVNKYVREENWAKLIQAFDVALKKVCSVSHLGTPCLCQSWHHHMCMHTYRSPCTSCKLMAT
jgi:midasin (ATPase involved in ribosome maturation)